MQGVTDAIAAQMPDIVAVQEATLLRNQSPGDLVLNGTTPATTVVFDYLELLVNALDARGAHYAVAATTYEWDVELPMLNLQPGTIDDVRQTDRDAILVNRPAAQSVAVSIAEWPFHERVSVSGDRPGVVHGWCSVDVFVRRQTSATFTHLDDECSQLQFLQGLELVGLLSSVNLPLILAGDFNADPFHRNGTQTYDVFVAAGFSDAWAATHPDDLGGGLTWGHEEFLADPATAFVWQLDHVFYRGAVSCST
jgi:endonuclease/exonuclease/phosphatase family metal-dependent hydrolase